MESYRIASRQPNLIPYPSANYPDIVSLPVGASVLALPELTALPTADASWRGKCVVVGGVTYKCRDVAELNGPDFLTILPPSADLRNNDWEASL